MAKAKLFKPDGSQAVRLLAEFRFDSSVNIRSREQLVEIGDRLSQSVAQGNLRAPAQFAFGERDVGLALFRIVLRQRLDRKASISIPSCR